MYIDAVNALELRARADYRTQLPIVNNALYIIIKRKRAEVAEHVI